MEGLLGFSDLMHAVWTKDSDGDKKLSALYELVHA